MTTDTAPLPSEGLVSGLGPRRLGVRLTDWLTATDHKRIGLMYIVTAFIFFLIGGLLAMAMRAELAQPGLQFMDESTYDEMFSMHGTIMMLLFATPVATGFGNYLVPLQIGAPDMVFPRLNALSYWLFLFGGLIVLSGFLAVGGAGNAGGPRIHP